MLQCRLMIKNLSITAVLPAMLALVAAATAAALDYAARFTTIPALPRRRIFSVDRVVVEPLPWPGNPQKTIDDTNLGKYLFEVIERGTNRVLYSRGFAPDLWRVGDDG